MPSKRSHSTHRTRKAPTPRQLSRAQKVRKRYDPAGLSSDQKRDAEAAKTRKQWLGDPSRTDLYPYDAPHKKRQGSGFSAFMKRNG